jgi:hypothetical protein
MSRNRSRSETDPDPEAEDGKSRGWFLWLPFLFDIKSFFVFPRSFVVVCFLKTPTCTLVLDIKNSSFYC